MNVLARTRCLLFLACALLATRSGATDYTNRAAGNWDAPATWTNGVGAIGCPSNSADTAAIVAGTVTGNISIPTIAGIAVTGATAVLDITSEPQAGTNSVVIGSDAQLKVKRYSSGNQQSIPNWRITLAGTAGHPATVYLYDQHTYCSAAVTLPSNAVGVLNANTASGSYTYKDSAYYGLLSAPSNAVLTIRQDSYWGDGMTIGNNNTNLDSSLLVGPGVFILGHANALGDEQGPEGVGPCTVSNASVTIAVTTVNPPFASSLCPRNLLLKTNITLTSIGNVANEPGYTGILTLGGPTTFSAPSSYQYNNPVTRFFGLIRDDPANPRATLYCAPGGGTWASGVLVTNAGNLFTGDIICRGGESKFTAAGALGQNPPAARKKLVVESGSLKLDATGTPDWTLNMDLGGSATVNVEDGARTLILSGSTVTPGTNDLPGTLTVNSHLAFAREAGLTNCTLSMVVNTVPTNGTLKVAGNVSALSNAVLSITAGASMQFADVKNRIFTVLQCNNNVSTQRFAAVTLNKAWPYTVRYQTNGVQVSFVPMPGTAVFLR